jgi:hypothetical protein
LKFYGSDDRKLARASEISFTWQVALIYPSRRRAQKMTSGCIVLRSHAHDQWHTDMTISSALMDIVT